MYRGFRPHTSSIYCALAKLPSQFFTRLRSENKVTLPLTLLLWINKVWTALTCEAHHLHTQPEFIAYKDGVGTGRFRTLDRRIHADGVARIDRRRGPKREAQRV